MIAFVPSTRTAREIKRGDGQLLFGPAEVVTTPLTPIHYQLTNTHINRPMTRVPDDAKTREAYCPACQQRQLVQVTVPWQDDTCLECGNNIPSEPNGT